MRIKRYKILDIGEIHTIYNKDNGRVSYYFFDLAVIDDGEIKRVSKIAYTKWEIRKIKKLKYIHILEEKEEEVVVDENN